MGALNRSTLAAQSLLEGEAEALTRRAIELAMSGDVTALRLCLERLLPRKSGLPIRLELPEMKTTSDLVAASAVVVRAVSGGEISLAEGQDLCRVLELHRRALESEFIEKRVAELEDRMRDR